MVDDAIGADDSNAGDADGAAGVEIAGNVDCDVGDAGNVKDDEIDSPSVRCRGTKDGVVADNLLLRAFVSRPTTPGAVGGNLL